MQMAQEIHGAEGDEPLAQGDWRSNSRGIGFLSYVLRKAKQVQAAGLGVVLVIDGESLLARGHKSPL